MKLVQLYNDQTKEKMKRTVTIVWSFYVLDVSHTWQTKLT